MPSTTARAISWTEQGLVPDVVIRGAIRRLLKQRLTAIAHDDIDTATALTREFIGLMDQSPIAPLAHKANEQHYEVPAEFFELVLGPHRKYSCALWDHPDATLADAEAAALDVTCRRAQLADGQRILELGCGWGSLTLFMANRFPHARIVAVSNSRSQREYIETQAAMRGLNNITIVTADMNDFSIDARFDRVVSVEMFEHMRNYRRLLARVHDWLVPGGLFFMHIFVHRSVPYEYVEQDESDWMSRHFFSGGIMPSHDLPLFFQDHLRIRQRWTWAGTHYQHTANAWLANLDEHRDQVLPLLAQVYDAGGHHPRNAEMWLHRWRIFFMSCAELWGYRNGQEWFVSHYLFERPVR